MSKFKVGDKVRILDGSKIDNYFNGWIHTMAKRVGKVYTIKSVYEKSRGTGYCLKEIPYIWDERGLELAEKHKFKVGDVVVAKKNNRYVFTTDGWRGVVTKATADWFDAEEFGYPKQNYEHLRYDGFDLTNDQKIVISHDGKTTTAELYDGKKVVKTATARCCPSDEFDFNIGAAIALERLTSCAYGHLESTVDSDLQWNRFIAGKIAFKVPKEKIEKFLEECEEHDLKWCSGRQATAWNPVKKTCCAFHRYVYMYHDEFGLEYDKNPDGNYTFEAWEDEADGLLNAKIYVTDGGNTKAFVTGKTYEIKDGKFIFNDFPLQGKLRNLDDLKYYLSSDSARNRLKHSAGLGHHCSTGVKYKVISSFDWDGFKAGNFNVIVNCDSIDRFLEECEAHEINWSLRKATEFNPIKYFDKESSFVRAMFQEIMTFDSTNECELKVVEGDLVYSFKPEIKESTVTL